MEDILSNFIDIVQNYILTVNPFIALIISFLLIVSESIIPILPLAVFITLNTMLFGNIIGFIISIAATITGCMLSFCLFKKIRKNKKDSNIVSKINNINFSTLTMILALPFTPAFAINIAAGITGISTKKYLMSLLISKPIIVYFWEFVGSSLIENISNPIICVKILLVLISIYIICWTVNKKLGIE